MEATIKTQIGLKFDARSAPLLAGSNAYGVTLDIETQVGSRLDAGSAPFVAHRDGSARIGADRCHSNAVQDLLRELSVVGYFQSMCHCFVRASSVVLTRTWADASTPARSHTETKHSYHVSPIVPCGRQHSQHINSN